MMDDDTPDSRARSERDDSHDRGTVVSFPSSATQPLPTETIRFDRRELDQLLRIYSLMVGAGEWRDYAIDQLRDRAVFSVFRRSSEMPLYRIEKNPKLARRQGAYSVVSASGQILKRGHELANVLKIFDKPLRVVASR
ncbi:DUF2794 domain-containing protein [Oricola sp.]|uniref:DUF2794 domain-containing protein n=1 Tax=Oricola sp. TaxID=1979950 RepID=UPI003BA9C342